MSAPSTNETGVVQTADVEALGTEGELPIGSLKMKTGYGVNNYVPPSLPAQGALARLASAQIEARIATDSDPDMRTVTIKMKGDAVDEIVEFLRVLKWLGDVGCSRSFTVNYDEAEQDGFDGRTTFCFDGDGSDHIRRVDVDGKTVVKED
jgi:hypothetical protein